MTAPSSGTDDSEIRHMPCARDILGLCIALVGELAAVALALRGHGNLSWVLALHAVVVLATGLVLLEGRSQSEDLTLAAISLLAILVTGPLGALAAFAMAALPAREVERAELLSGWYERLSQAGGVEPATAMHDRVAAGRVLMLDAAGPQRFVDVIDHGTLAERQTALGLMARNFHPDYAPALEAALRSAEPVVRVQAAAVVAHVRADLKTEIKSGALSLRDAAGLPAAERLRHAGRFDALARCSLVEAADRARCRETAGLFLQGALSRDGVLQASQSGAGAAASRALENFLLSTGRLKEFRVARRTGSLAAAKGYKLRRVRSAEASAS
jgi:hypothetical protein